MFDTKLSQSDLAAQLQATMDILKASIQSTDSLELLHQLELAVDDTYLMIQNHYKELSYDFDEIDARLNTVYDLINEREIDLILEKSKSE